MTAVDVRPSDFPLLVSVDDHVVEPPRLWIDRAPRGLEEEVPHVRRERVPSKINAGEDRWADVWYFGSARMVHQRGPAAVGYDAEQVDTEPMTFDEMRPGCFDVEARLADMDIDGVEASICFPNTFVRFCGQLFLEATDRELAWHCLKSYNDWLVEEWCSPSQGRLVGAGIIPLWDADLAAGEVKRNASRGLTSVCFTEIPARLGLPSMYSGYWDPFFGACAETSTVINLHIGSSSSFHSTSEDAPYVIRISNHFSNCAFSLSDWLVSGAFDRFPSLKIAFSEGQAGWIPYLMSRLDGSWRRGTPLLGCDLPRLPSSYLADHVYACVFDDPVGIRLLDQIGEDNICWETDYPHNDSTWPNSRKHAEKLTAGLAPTVREKVLRLNAARLYNVERVLQTSTGIR